MPNLDTQDFYTIHLDLIRKTENEQMYFNLSDSGTSDFYIKITKDGLLIDLTQCTVTMYVVKPNKNSEFINLEYNAEKQMYYCNLPNNFKNIRNKYKAQIAVYNPITKETKITRSNFTYQIESDVKSEIEGAVDQEEQENLLTELMSRLTSLEENGTTMVSALIDDSNTSTSKSYSSKKVEDIKKDIDSQIKDKATKQEIEVERKRIDSFTRLAEGSTTGDAELIDARIGADGRTYDNIGGAIRNQFNNLKTKGNNLYSKLFEKSINLLNKDSLVIDYYVSNNDGNLISYKDWVTSYYIEINNYEKYMLISTFTNNIYSIADNIYYAFYDKNKKFTNGGRLLNDGNEMIPNAESVYLRVSFGNFFLKNHVMVGSSINLQKLINTDSNSYVECYEKFLYEQQLQDYYNIITVKKDGTGDFATIVEAVNSINDSSKNNQYVIEIYSGEYDIITELGGDSFLAKVENDDFEFGERNGLRLPNYVHLKGVGNVILKGEIQDSKATVNTTTRISTLNVWMNNNIENVTITAKNLRYAIHDETNNMFHNLNRKIENCKVIHKGNISGTWSACQAYAAGTGGGGNYKFINSVFESVGSQGWSMHNNENQYGNNVLMDGCYVKGKSSTDSIRLYYFKKNTEQGNFYIKNTIYDSMLVRIQSESIPSTNVWNVYNFVENTFTPSELNSL